ncbi:MAG: hypothetical protein P4M12_11675 [Gammaproteobacteria bacterium]|nr:hypothetical protein [Gammaproteobacteria bacterium]
MSIFLNNFARKVIKFRGDISACEDAKQNGYGAICVNNLHELPHTEQKARIANLFERLFLMFNLPVPKVSTNFSITEEICIYSAATALTFFQKSKTFDTTQKHESITTISATI